MRGLRKRKLAEPDWECESPAELDATRKDLKLLPDNVLVQLFSYLSPSDLVSAETVSKCMKQFADISWKNLSFVDFEKIIKAEFSPTSSSRIHSTILDRCWKKIREIKGFGYLTHNDCSPIKNNILPYFSHGAPMLTHLQLSYYVQSNFCTVLNSLPSLECLEWDQLEIKSEGEKFDSIFKNLTSLKKLVLIKARITDSCRLTMPEQIQEIHFVRLDYAFEECDTPVYFPFSMLDHPPTCLKVLNIPQIRGYKLKGFQPLVLPAKIDLHKFVGALPKLEYLDLSELGGSSELIDLIRIDSFQYLSFIEQIHLSGSHFTTNNKEFKFSNSLRVLTCNHFEYLTADFPRFCDIIPNLIELSLELEDQGVFDDSDSDFNELLLSTAVHTPNLQRLTLRRWKMGQNTLLNVTRHLPLLNYLDISKSTVCYSDVVQSLKVLADQYCGDICQCKLTIHAWHTKFMANDSTDLQMNDAHIHELKAIVPRLEWITSSIPPKYRHKTKIGRWLRETDWDLLSDDDLSSEDESGSSSHTSTDPDMYFY